MPSIKATACVQSAVVPAVTATLTGIPCASTARCILLLSPLLCGPYPDYRPWRLPHGGGLCNGWHRSSTIQNLDHQEFFPYSLVSPTNKALVNGSPFAIFRRQIPPRRASTQYPEDSIDEEAIILCHTSPLPALPKQMKFQQGPCGIRDVMAALRIRHKHILAELMCFAYHKSRVNTT